MRERGLVSQNASGNHYVNAVNALSRYIHLTGVNALVDFPFVSVEFCCYLKKSITC